MSPDLCPDQSHPTHPHRTYPVAWILKHFFTCLAHLCNRKTFAEWSNTNKQWKRLDKIINVSLKIKKIEGFKMFQFSFSSLFGSSRARVISTSTLFLTVFMFYILTIQRGEFFNNENKKFFSQFRWFITGDISSKREVLVET